MDPLAKGFLFLFSQAGTHHLKRMDKELLLLCTENMSLGQSILFSLEYYPPSDLTGDVSSFSWKPSLWLIWQVFLCPAPGKTVFWLHLASPLSVLVRRRMWWYHLFCFLNVLIRIKGKSFLPFNEGKCFFFSCFDKVDFSNPSLNGNFKRRLILKLLKWRLTAPVFIDRSCFPLLFLLEI